ncbi:MAG TPA: zinc-binding dehydrogenase [Candidatus Limadaptatus stercoripullorum]|uniref:Zinc-binding dehydrogenase n=1 Tax=Candidatus Limadaptatus stercoripullorum TaxID=2840846 RepID=A0A9D1NB68_9FIRM|nr:zinc-binding dehydrogenase [Candidatus Limadaptatus stercoripullorum]
MKAWHIENLNRIKLVESVLPKREGEIKLKMSKVAISSTDFAYFAAGEEDEHGKSVVVPGHSAVAYVSSEDSAAGLKLGARVVVSPFVRYEEHGVAKVKVLGVDTDGLLGDFASVPEENVYALPDGIPDDEAIFAEYIALGNNVLNSMEADKGDFVVIVGASTLGLVLSQLALYYQMIPILVDLDAEKLALAASWGVYYLLNPTYDNLERRVEEITGGRMAEASVYVGDGVPFDCAFRLVKDKGEVVVAGYSVRAGHNADVADILAKQLRVIGVADGYGEMSSAINLLANRIVKTEGLIGARIGFDEVPEMVEQCAEYPYQYNKILITVD